MGELDFNLASSPSVAVMTQNTPAQVRPSLTGAVSDDDALAAISLLTDRLQAGVTFSDADRYDSLFADDLLWGSPKGQVLQGYGLLNSIHRQMMGPQTAAAPASRFEPVQHISPAPGIVVAQIRRQAVLETGEPDSDGSSEMAMYVLVERDGQWWLAAGQNTPITDSLPGR